MLSPQVRETIRTLNALGKPIREISRLLKISRNAIRGVIHKKTKESRVMRESKSKQELLLLLPDLFKRCEGNVVRIQEILREEYQKKIAYSTLTYWCRKYALGEPKIRVGQYHQKPGEEMQHDTSPHRVMIGDKKVIAQCASLVLAYSRKIYIQYYPCFTRFEAKIFLQEAFEFMGGVCENCIIDNTSTILSAGAGENAQIASEMEIFCRIYGFVFVAHEINHPDRKARVERQFNWAERNFLVGRHFDSWEDLNKQARTWCVGVANRKVKRVLGMSPEQAYLQEKSQMKALPAYVPPIYQLETRLVNVEGYIHLDTNLYPVPEKFIGCTVDVYKYKDRVEINYHNEIIATHSRLVGKRYTRLPADQYHQSLVKKRSKQSISEAEVLLRANAPDLLNDYLNDLKKQVRGRGNHFFQRLLSLKQLYPEEAFLLAIQQAHHYGLYDISRLENLILDFASRIFFKFPEDEHDV